MEPQELSHIACRHAKRHSHFGRQFHSFLQNQTDIYRIIQQLLSLVFTQMSRNLFPLKDLHMDVYSNFIHHCQNLEDSGLLFSAEKKRAIVLTSAAYALKLERYRED